MNRIKAIILSGLYLFLTGCVSYSTINLDVLKPAGVDIPVNIASVVVVDNAFPFHPEDSGVHQINLPGRKYSVDTIHVDDFGMRTVESFGEALKAHQFFDSVHIVKQQFNSGDDGRPMDPLSAFEIDTLCSHFDAQAVISLDHYDYGTTINIMEMPDYYFATLDSRNSTYWKIHNCLADDLVDIHLQKDTIFWEGAGNSVGDSGKDLPSIKEALEAGADHAGEKYAGYVAPTWTIEERIFYKQGHPLFFRASELIANRQWEAAVRVWNHVYEESKGKQKARAAFNMALGQELLGNLLEAAAWGYRAVEEYDQLGGLAVSEREINVARRYYVELARRLQEKKKLDNQFGIDE